MAKTDRQDRFLGFLEEHKKILFKVSNSYCRDPENRRDLVQEILVQLWRSFDRFDDQYRFSTWMYRIALNVAISYRRRETRRSRDTEHLGDVLDEIPAGSRDDDELRLVHSLIDRLNPLRKALMLLYLEGHRHDTIAEILGISASNVATQISRIKKQLARDLGGS